MMMIDGNQAETRGVEGSLTALWNLTVHCKSRYHDHGDDDEEDEDSYLDFEDDHDEDRHPLVELQKSCCPMYWDVIWPINVYSFLALEPA